MAFQKVASVGDIPDGSLKVYEIGDKAVAVCNVSGSYYAIEDVCTHDFASFEQGELDGCEIECPRHGARFNVTDGSATELPAVVPIDTFEVRVEGDAIEVDI